MATIKSLIIWSLILALVGLIECKKKKPLPGQPGFKYGGTQGDSSSMHVFSDGNVWIIVTATASVLAFLSLACSPCCYKYIKANKDRNCYLCHISVKAKVWTEHRAGCAQNNLPFLNGLPTPCSIFCPQCDNKLRLWPVQDHAKFRCHSKKTSCKHHGLELNNDGSNRFNCYIHDFDMCGECVRDKIQADNIEKGPEEEEDEVV